MCKSNKELNNEVTGAFFSGNPIVMFKSFTLGGKLFKIGSSKLSSPKTIAVFSNSASLLLANSSARYLACPIFLGIPVIEMSFASRYSSISG